MSDPTFRQSAMRRNVALMYAAQAIRYLAPMVLVPFYGRTLGVGIYGQLLSAMALMQIAWVVVEWGLPSTGLRDAAAAQTSDARSRLVGEQIAGRLALASLVIPICLLLTVLVPALHENLLLSLLGLILGISNSFNMTWYFQGRMQFRISAVIELIGLIASTVSILLFVKVAGDAWLIPGSMFIVSVLSFLTQLYLSFESAPEAGRILGSPLRALKVSALLFVDRGQAMLIGPLSILLLGFVAPAAQVASFAVAERLLGVLIALLGPINQVFASMLAQSVSRLHQGQPIEKTHQLMRKLSAFSVGLYLLIAGISFAAADTVILFVLGPSFQPVVPTFRILTFALALIGMVSVLCSTVMYPMRCDREIAVVSSVRMASTLACVTIGGALLGNEGAAWARLLGAGAALGAAIVCLKQKSLWAFLVCKR